MNALGSMRDCGAVKLNAISFNGHVFEKIDKWLPIVTSLFLFCLFVCFFKKKTADRYNRLVSPWVATQLKYMCIVFNEIFLWAVFLFV